MARTVEPLNSVFGAEIRGIDLSRPLSEGDFEWVRDVWLKNKVILIRDQTLDEGNIVDFGRRLGELERHVRDDASSRTHPEVLLVSNKSENGKPVGVLGDMEAPWHIDQIYIKQPTYGTMLYALEIPNNGGRTFVCDLATAYARLPDSLKKLIEGRKAINSADHFNRMFNGGMSDEQVRRVPEVTHPIIRTHPVMGRKSLFLSPSHVRLIEGYSYEETRKIVAQMMEFIAENDDLVYRHHWRVGDVLMWDNTSTMHRREPFDGTAEIRLLKRISFMHDPANRTPV